MDNTITQEQFEMAMKKRIIQTSLEENQKLLIRVQQEQNQLSKLQKIVENEITNKQKV